MGGCGRESLTQSGTYTQRELINTVGGICTFPGEKRRLVDFTNVWRPPPVDSGFSRAIPMC
jgi:hypothetical protein